LKTLLAVFLIEIAGAQTPPDQARQTEVQKEKERERLRETGARSAPILIGWPTLTPVGPIIIMQPPLMENK